MKYYQVVITLYRYHFWSGKWKPKMVFPSPVIFEDRGQANMFLTKFSDILRRRGWKLKEGHWGWSIDELHFEPRPKFTPHPSLTTNTP